MRTLKGYAFTDVVWRHRYLRNQIQMRLQNASGSDDSILFIDPTLSIFKLTQILKVSYPFFKNIILPPNITQKSNLYEFLLSNKSAQHIEVQIPNDSLYIRNKASDLFTNEIYNLIRAPNGIYNQIISTIQTTKVHDNNEQFPLFSNYFIQYYLKLQIETYLRSHKINPNNVLINKDDLLIYLMQSNSVDKRESILSNRIHMNSIRERKQNLKRKIDEYYKKGNKRFLIFRVGFILVSALHLVSFTYMIFYVDWLGWDIIQPLTFSVACLYFLLGMRFYKKVGKPYTHKNLFYWCLEKSLNPKDQIQLRILQDQMKKEQENLKNAQIKELLSKNVSTCTKLYSNVNDL